MEKDFYSILGVDKNASESEIKKAYKKAAVKWHPDRWSKKSDSEKKHAEEMFKEVNEANSVLSDPDKRAKYDRFGDDWDKVNSGFGGGPDMSDIFANMARGFGRNPFADMFNNGRQQGPEPGQTIKIRINLSLEEIFNGTTREIEIKVEQRCKKCNGTGGDSEICPHCHGTGMITTRQQFGPNQFVQSSQPCTHCHGTGKIIKSKCKECNGVGMHLVNKKIKVNIRPGIANGEIITYPNQGFESKHPRGANGDVIVQCIYNIDDSKYIIQGNIVFEKIEIPYYDCIVGCTKKVKLPNGKERSIVIKPNSVDGDKSILYNASFNGGNYIFIISVQIPKSASDKEIELLKEIQKLHN